MMEEKDTHYLLKEILRVQLFILDEIKNINENNFRNVREWKEPPDRLTLKEHIVTCLRGKPSTFNEIIHYLLYVANVETNSANESNFRKMISKILYHSSSPQYFSPDCYVVISRKKSLYHVRLLTEKGASDFRQDNE